MSQDSTHRNVPSQVGYHVGNLTIQADAVDFTRFSKNNVLHAQIRELDTESPDAPLAHSLQLRACQPMNGRTQPATLDIAVIVPVPLEGEATEEKALLAKLAGHGLGTELVHTTPHYGREIVVHSQDRFDATKAFSILLNLKELNIISEASYQTADHVLGALQRRALCEDPRKISDFFKEPQGVSPDIARIVGREDKGPGSNPFAERN